MNELQTQILEILDEYCGIIVARSIMETAKKKCSVGGDYIEGSDFSKLLVELTAGLTVFIRDPHQQQECLSKIRGALNLDENETSSTPAGELIMVRSEGDIVRARNVGRQLCEIIGFPRLLQVKVATAISELTRNIVQYTDGGTVEINVIKGDPMGIEIIARDHGSGISNLEAILNKRYRSKTGMGLGLVGSRNLMDEFHIISKPDYGTQITARKFNR